jgi:hypothetical protein
VPRYYHSTTPESAELIVRDGFRDSEGYYGFLDLDEPLRGVFIADTPVDENEEPPRLADQPDPPTRTRTSQTTTTPTTRPRPTTVLRPSCRVAGSGRPRGTRQWSHV